MVECDSSDDRLVSDCLRPAVFLDRDGVIVVPEFRDGRSFAPRTIEEFQIYPEAEKCLSALSRLGFMLIVVTNQPDVGNGLVDRQVVETMHKILLEVLPIVSIQVCYHKQSDDCCCRKPKPGMLLDSAREFDIDLRRSFMIGDRRSDIEAGNRAGCRTVFIDHQYCSEKRPSGQTMSVKNLNEALGIIISQMQGIDAAAR